MGTHRDDIDLAAELRALRPAPRQDFTEKLDTRAAEGFPRTGQRRSIALPRRIAELFDAVPRRRIALPAAAVALTALVAATSVISLSESTPDTGSGMKFFSDPGDKGVVDGGDGKQSSTQFSAPVERAASGGGVAAGNSSGVQLGSESPAIENQGAHRDVERDAELVLGPSPGEFDEVVKRAFSTVHAVNGVVLSSQVHDRKARNGGEADASFRLLIPSARLSDALASLSQIADVRSRHESTLDITAPTVSAEERLDDSRARIDGLLAQLASAESEEERVAIESELRGERREAAALQAQLDRLRRRAGFAQVTLRIESVAERDSTGPWGVGNALDDAARILTVAAGVTLIGLAVLGPLALVAIAIWLAHRLWLRRRRENALAQAA